MDAIVLAGGYATRLWPITRDRPKMLLPIGETTVIDRILVELETEPRIDDIYVSTNARFADRFETHLDAAGYQKPTLSVEGTTSEDEKLGVVGALAELIDREGLSRDTLVIAGDNLMSMAIGDFLDHFAAHDGPTVAAYDVGSAEQASHYGVVTVEEATITAFAEKPADPESTLISIACYGFPAEVLQDFETYLAGDHNPDEPGWFIQWLVGREAVTAYTFDGAWFDIGTPASYLDAVSWYLDDGTMVAESATVTNSTLGDGVHVMANATVTDSTLERTVVFPGASIVGSEIRNSVVDTEAVLEEIALSGAQIASYTRVANDR